MQWTLKQNNTLEKKQKERYGRCSHFRYITHIEIHQRFYDRCDGISDYVYVCMWLCVSKSSKYQKVHGYTSNNQQPAYQFTNTENQSEMFFLGDRQRWNLCKRLTLK